MRHYHINREIKDDPKTKHILLQELAYDPRYELKTESVFAQCNGKFGVRAANDFRVLGENRGMFVGGLYQKAYETEVTELVNCPDLIEMELEADGESFTLDRCEMLWYSRSLDVMTGELKINYGCSLESGLQLAIKSRRFVSAVDEELLCQEVEITALNRAVNHLVISSGINGQITNSGVSHFHQVDCRVYDKTIMEMKSYLKENTLLLLSAARLKADSDVDKTDYLLGRRKIMGRFHSGLAQNGSLRFTKYSLIHTELKESESVNKLKSYLPRDYDTLFQIHCRLMNQLWSYAGIHIEGASLEEEAAICFAQYHLLGMTPKATSDYSVGAKGLTGEGYKGHVFWDVELFIQPFFLHVFPEVCRNLLIYRYKGLPGARAKARDYGYQGAMFPWEAAKNGYEETPLYAALNIHTGKANKVWSGMKEHHVTADIVYAIWQYYSFTRDEAFLKDYGMEIIFEAASFWISRAEYNEEKKCYEILDIIGPDEYTEHIDNNAYTNYLAWFNVKLAAELYERLNPEEIRRFDLADKIESFRRFQELIYLPKPDENHLIPQDDTFLSKRELPQIMKYKNAAVKQAVLLDYSREEVVDMQVLKQADTVMLLNLFPSLFHPEVVKRNVLFYESRTIHDSSLSYCAHAQACGAIGETKLAWNFFEKAMRIDLDENPKDSTDGIHAASLGGIWNCVIFGFVGLSHENEKLKFRPKLPAHWKSVSFNLKIYDSYAAVFVTSNLIKMTCDRPIRHPLIVIVQEKEYEFNQELCIEWEGING